jgi:hypothetical protein
VQFRLHDVRVTNVGIKSGAVAQLDVALAAGITAVGAGSFDGNSAGVSLGFDQRLNAFTPSTFTAIADPFHQTAPVNGGAPLLIDDTVAQLPGLATIFASSVSNSVSFLPSGGKAAVAVAVDKPTFTDVASVSSPTSRRSRCASLSRRST